MNSRLMVYVRVKPLHNQKSIIDIVDDESLVFDPVDPECDPTDEYIYHGRRFKSIGVKRNKNSKYSFDRVFNDHSTNYSIYEVVTKPMIDATISGLNCTVFAYGATGSGKTFTMLGKPTNPGVIYYTTKNLYEQLSTISEMDPMPAELKICYFEIYNEKIRDLLVNNYIRCGNKRLRTTPERSRARQQGGAFDLPVCEGPSDGLIIPDLSYHSPENAEQLIELLEAGNINRSQHPTDANSDSSRSHAIFQIILTRRTRRHNGSGDYELQNSKMSLIDLAGSERASVAYRPGNDRSKNLQREGGNINKSLLALGNCINALADPRRGHKHIPYRNSKLTRLLRDSLGGKCRTAMIATICQHQTHYDDTQNTLIYASRAKCIKTKPGRNFTDVAIQPKNYNLIIENQNKQITALQLQNDQFKIQLEELKNENNTLRAQQDKFISHQAFNHHQTFTTHNHTLNAHHQTFTPHQNINPHQTYIAAERSNFLDESRYFKDLESLYNERGAIKMDILKYESKYRMNELKLAFKQMDDTRLQNIHSNYPKLNGNSTILLASGLTEPISNPDQTQALKVQLDFYEKERKALLDRARNNEMHIRDVIASMTTEFDIRGFGTLEEFDAIIEPYVCEKERLQELEEKKYCEQHAYDIAQQGINRLVAAENLLNEVSTVVRYTHAILKGRGLSDLLEAKLSNLLKKLEGKKSVVWKDDKYAMENKSDEPMSHLSSIHENFSLNFLTPFKDNNTLNSRRISKNLVSFTNYTPEQSNVTFDASQ